MPRRKSEYKVQVMVDEKTGMEASLGWVDIERVNISGDNSYGSVAHAIKAIKRQRLEGEFRIIAVKRIVNVSKVESVKVSVADAEGEAK